MDTQNARQFMKEYICRKGFGYFFGDMTQEEILEAMQEYADEAVKNFVPPAELKQAHVMLSLPSDEKINLEALATEGEYRNSEWKRGYKIGFMNCAKWMKEQIKKLNQRGNGA